MTEQAILGLASARFHPHTLGIYTPSVPFQTPWLLPALERFCQPYRFAASGPIFTNFKHREPPRKRARHFAMRNRTSLTLKPETIEIKSILNEGRRIYGLGSDNNIYRWLDSDGFWALHSLKKPQA